MVSADTQRSYAAIPLDAIQTSPHQARKSFDEEALSGLAESLKQEGLIEPIVVRKSGDGYELISGERRVRAAKMIGWTEIDAKIITVLSDGEAAAKGLIENIQREDLNPIEEAEGFRDLRKLNDAHWTQETIGRVCGKRQEYVSQSLALLALPEMIQESIRRRILSWNHGIELMRINNANSQKSMASKMIKGGWSIKKTRAEIERLLGKSPATAPSPASPPSPRDPLAKLWELLSRNDALSPTVFWEVKYGAQNVDGSPMKGWYFFVSPMAGEESAKPDITEWFRRMAKALGSKDPDGVVPEVEKPVKRTERLPKNAAEEAELLEIATKQGPKAVLEWIYGANNPVAAASPFETWEALGLTAQEGLKQLLDELGHPA